MEQLDVEEMVCMDCGTQQPCAGQYNPQAPSAITTIVQQGTYMMKPQCESHAASREFLSPFPAARFCSG